MHTSPVPGLPRRTPERSAYENAFFKQQQRPICSGVGLWREGRQPQQTSAWLLSAPFRVRNLMAQLRCRCSSPHPSSRAVSLSCSGQVLGESRSGNGRNCTERTSVSRVMAEARCRRSHRWFWDRWAEDSGQWFGSTTAFVFGGTLEAPSESERLSADAVGEKGQPGLACQFPHRASGRGEQDGKKRRPRQFSEKGDTHRAENGSTMRREFKVHGLGGNSTIFFVMSTATPSRLLQKTISAMTRALPQHNYSTSESGLQLPDRTFQFQRLPRPLLATSVVPSSDL